MKLVIALRSHKHNRLNELCYCTQTLSTFGLATFSLRTFIGLYCNSNLIYIYNVYLMYTFL